ncbi:processed acidic surface protein [Fictibacillus phosphorivorans]|uniref:processed acidic surface protein n=1 Tax=Fictibacillus phosphorivorans TaxID=1221500 RepID=UPI003CED0F94
MRKRISSMFLVLALVLSVMPNVSFAAVAMDDPKLTSYLQEISATRGLEITVEDFEDYLLEYYGSGLEDWENFEELDGALGEVIEADYSNLQSIYEAYDLDEASLMQLLEDNGSTIDHFIYVEDLDMEVGFYVGGDPLEDIFTELGLTDEELEALFVHFDSMSEKLEDPAILKRLEELGAQMESFEDFDSVEELTDAQVKQIISIYDEILEIFELDAKYYLKKGKEKKAITLNELLLLKDPNGYNLVIELYNKNGDFILDMELTADMIGSDIIEDIGEDVKEVPKVVEKIKDSPKTEKGGKLPNTASDFLPNTLIGLVVAGAGFVLYRRVRKTA